MSSALSEKRNHACLFLALWFPVSSRSANSLTSSSGQFRRKTFVAKFSRGIIELWARRPSSNCEFVRNFMTRKFRFLDRLAISAAFLCLNDFSKWRNLMWILLDRRTSSFEHLLVRSKFYSARASGQVLFTNPGLFREGRSLYQSLCSFTHRLTRKKWLTLSFFY